MYLSNPKLLGKCSCLHCKKTFVSGGINSHYRLMHTDEGQVERMRIHHQTYKEKADRIAKYNLNPTKCQQCSADIDYSRRKNKFCSSSCASSYNNLLHSPESRKRQAEKASKTLKLRYAKEFEIDNSLKIIETPILSQARTDTPIKSPSCKVSFCIVCFKSIPNKYRKTCSQSCYIKNCSRRMSSRLKDPNFRKNYGRQKRSYLEESFSKWLDLNKVLYEYEIQFKNHELNKYYYADFVFRNLNLIIELDGTQHRKTVEQDQIRDEYIERVYGFKIYRITHKEYQAKTKYSMICGLLGIQL